MSKLEHVTAQTFDAEVRNSDLPVVVDFYATWCPPCRALGPILDRLSDQFSGQIKFVKVNSDEEQELAIEFNVTSLPTIVVMSGGKNVGQFSGLPPEEELKRELQRWLDASAAT